MGKQTLNTPNYFYKIFLNLFYAPISVIGSTCLMLYLDKWSTLLKGYLKKVKMAVKKFFLA
jgi:hypothetical protein